MQTITLFISYSWDSEEHKEWVRKLSDHLVKNGIQVILDQYDLAAGKNMTYFMESSIEKSDKVLIILTPNYKIKSQNRTAGVGFEYSLISSELFETQKDNSKFIPILRSGDKDKSVPGFLKSLIYHGMQSDDRFDADVFNLLRIIYDEPEITKPTLGNKPDFSQNVDPIIGIAKSISDEKELQQRKRLFEFNEAQKVMWKEISELFQAINEKAEEYRTKTKLFFKSESNQHRCVLIAKGLCLNIYFSYSHYGDFNKNELIISVWDKPLSVKNDLHYFPGDEPKELWGIKLKPVVSDELSVDWINGNLKYTTAKLNEFSFAKILEFVKKRPPTN